jgi:hypothetical protein
VALETWLEALSGLLAPELPHDLMALWVYPPEGPAVLVGPSALAQDSLEVPTPAPHLGQDELYTMEQRIRTAGYASVVCMAVPHGDRDVGLLLLADLRHARYGLPEAVLLRNVADSLGPTLARVARQGREPLEPPRDDGAPPPPERRRSEPGRKLVELHELLAKLGLAESASRTPREFSEFVSQALQPMLPHDRIQILVPDASAQEHYRFDRHGPGTFWSDPALVVTRDQFDPAALWRRGRNPHRRHPRAARHAVVVSRRAGAGQGPDDRARRHRRAPLSADPAWRATSSLGAMARTSSVPTISNCSGKWRRWWPCGWTASCSHGRCRSCART